jgi:hypothetical protein
VWCKEYPQKYQKNLFIQSLIKDLINITESEHKQIDLIALSLDEPLLTP